MQGNPYWPLNGPSFFSSQQNSFGAVLPPTALGTKSASGPKFLGTDGTPTTLSYMMRRLIPPKSRSWESQDLELVMRLSLC